MGREVAMFNGLQSNLPMADGNCNTSMARADKQNARANVEYTNNEINTERAVQSGYFEAVWNADGGNSMEKKRGKILKKRLDLINEFLVRGKGKNIPFGAFLKKNGLDETIFLGDLPSYLQFTGIANETPQSKKMLAYGVSMNEVYVEQMMQDIINTEDDTLSCAGCEGECGDSEECD